MPIPASRHAQELGLCLSALAQWGVCPSTDFMAAAVARATELLPVATPPPLVAVLWALGRLQYKPAPAVLHQMLAALQVRGFCWCAPGGRGLRMGGGGWPLRRQQAAARRLAARMDVRRAEGAASGGRSGNGAYNPDPQARPLANPWPLPQGKLRLLDARSLCDVAWALCCLRHRPGAKWLAELEREALARWASPPGLRLVRKHEQRRAHNPCRPRQPHTCHQVR